jgi:hypothetical protein
MRNFITLTLHNVLYRVIKLKRMKWVRHVATTREMRSTYKILVEKLEEKR